MEKCLHDALFFDFSIVSQTKSLSENKATVDAPGYVSYLSLCVQTDAQMVVIYMHVWASALLSLTDRQCETP